MSGNIQIATYRKTDIEFELRPDRVMINATEMAAAFKKQPKEFLRIGPTKAFMKACLSGDYNPQMGLQNESDLVIVKPKSGTWMHRILALKFAAWLSPEFEVWVYSTIEQILYGDIISIKKIEDDIQSLKYQVESYKIICRRNPDYLILEDLQTKLYQAHSRKRISLQKFYKKNFHRVNN